MNESIDITIRHPRDGEYLEESFAKKLRVIFELIYLFNNLPKPLYWSELVNGDGAGYQYGLVITKHKGEHLLPVRAIDAIVAIVSEQVYEMPACKAKKNVFGHNADGVRIRTDQWCEKIIIEKVMLYYGK